MTVRCWSWDVAKCYDKFLQNLPESEWWEASRQISSFFQWFFFGHGINRLNLHFNLEFAVWLSAKATLALRNPAWQLTAAYGWDPPKNILFTDFYGIYGLITGFSRVNYGFYKDGVVSILPLNTGLVRDKYGIREKIVGSPCFHHPGLIKTSIISNFMPHQFPMLDSRFHIEKKWMIL